MPQSFDPGYVDAPFAALAAEFPGADVYPASYPGNIIDITGLRGCFVVLHRADPAHHIIESNEANNVSARVVRLPYKPGRQGCPAYVP